MKISVNDLFERPLLQFAPVDENTAKRGAYDLHS